MNKMLRQKKNQTQMSIYSFIIINQNRQSNPQVAMMGSSQLGEEASD